jgi:hypothetical protein
MSPSSSDAARREGWLGAEAQIVLAREALADDRSQGAYLSVI